MDTNASTWAMMQWMCRRVIAQERSPKVAARLDFPFKARASGGGGCGGLSALAGAEELLPRAVGRSLRRCNALLQEYQPVSITAAIPRRGATAAHARQLLRGCPLARHRPAATASHT